MFERKQHIRERERERREGEDWKENRERVKDTAFQHSPNRASGVFSSINNSEYKQTAATLTLLKKKQTFVL